VVTILFTPWLKVHHQYLGLLSVNPSMAVVFGALPSHGLIKIIKGFLLAYLNGLSEGSLPQKFFVILPSSF